MSKRLARIRKRERELRGRPMRFGSDKYYVSDMETRFTQKFISKKETEIGFKIDKQLNNWERIKQQLIIGHNEAMKEKYHKLISEGAQGAEFVRPVIVLKIDTYDNGKFVGEQEMIAYDVQMKGNWQELDPGDVDVSLDEQELELEGRISAMSDSYDYSITGVSLYYGFFYG